MSVLEEIHSLKPEQTQLLHAEVIDGQSLEVRQYEQYRWMNIGGQCIQSLVDVDLPDQFMLPNIQAMLGALLFCPHPEHVLNLGFGGGSIERFFMSKLPELDLTSVDSNESVIHLTKKYFSVPEDYVVVMDSAEHYLSLVNDKFDIIFCDIFFAERHPDCLYEDEFYANTFNALKDQGVLALNLLPLSEQEIIEILIQIRNHFKSVLLLETPNHANIILFALTGEAPSLKVMETQAVKLLYEPGIDIRDVPARLNVLPAKAKE